VKRREERGERGEKGKEREGECWRERVDFRRVCPFREAGLQVGVGLFMSKA
jgi:hypothetical protein